MPKIPFYQQQVTPSAEVGAARVNPGMFNSEWAEVGQLGGEISKIGKTASSYANATKNDEVIAEKEAAVVAEKVRRAKVTDQKIQGETKAIAGMDAITNGLAERNDYDKFAGEFGARSKELKEKLLEDETLDPEARRALSLQIDRMIVNEAQKVKGIERKKWHDQSRAGLDIAVSESEKRGDLGRAEGYLNAAKEAGYISAQEHAARTEAVSRNIEYYAVRDAIENDPDMGAEWAGDIDSAPSLRQEDRDSLKNYAAKIKKSQNEAMADATEARVINALSTGQYDTNAEIANIDLAEAKGAISKKDAATFKSKIRNGDIEKTSDATQAKANTIELDYVTGKIDKKTAKAAVMGLFGDSKIQDSSRLLSLIKDFESADPAAKMPSLKHAYQIIGDLEKVNTFGNRTVDKDGRDTTDSTRRLEMDEAMKAARNKPGWSNYDSENPADAKELSKREAAARKNLLDKWNKQDKDYNDTLAMIRTWATANPNATPEEAKKAVDSFTQTIREGAAFNKALKNGK